MQDFSSSGSSSKKEDPLTRTVDNSYPLSVRFRFTPGGGDYQAASASQQEDRHSLATLPAPPTQLLQQAVTADDRLRKYTLLQGFPDNSPYFLPSLSVLTEAAFGRLTGIAPNNVKEWADALVLAYLEEDERNKITKPYTEEEIWQHTAHISPSTSESLATKLKEMHAQAELRHEQEMSDSTGAFRRRRPCGYVFQRGDIAWNCRTCQTDPTCVICDDCFRQSDHQGHEVYFHRTTPGGCCDCGDLEAWKIEGCCDVHRPHTQQATPPSTDDPMEAVKMAQQGLEEETTTLTTPPTALTPKTTAALATVIGAAVHCIVQAVDGSGIGADPSQFKHKWAVEAALVANGKVTPYTMDDDTENRQRRAKRNPSHYATNVLPMGYRLSLRLHNDDVHTFDEVIDAMHESPRHRRNNPAGGAVFESLVARREQATSLTQHVDSDGQVTVLNYDRLSSAMQGFRRLKSRGLHCSVVSSPQVQQELRARALVTWLAEISSAHPVASALLIQALVQVQGSANETVFAGVTPVWKEARSVPLWASPNAKEDEPSACKRRFRAFPPGWISSFLTQQESHDLYKLGRSIVPPSQLAEVTGALPRSGDCVQRTRGLYAPERYHKSPHSLWGTLPARYVTDTSVIGKHPFLVKLVGDTRPIAPQSSHDLTEAVYVVDTDLRKQQEADRITSSVFPHKLPGLHLLSGVATVPLEDLDEQGMPKQEVDDEMDQPLPKPETYLPNAMEYRHLLATSSFRAPLSPVLLLLLLDPYPTKQLRGALHSLFLSLLTDARFRCRFAGALAIAYRPISTLFCAGVGTEADTPLHFAVQILTAGSLVRALGSAPAVASLLLPDQPTEETDMLNDASATIGVFCSPIAHTIVRCIHTNLLGATKEVNMILNNTYSGNDEDDGDIGASGNDGLLPALTYVAGEHPLMTLLPAAPDDGFLDSRSTRHKRLPHLLRDLEYVMETPGTALRLLLPQKYPVYQGPQLSFRGEDVLTFSVVFSRMLRLAQGMDPQKRKISGGHVEYEQNRWLEAFGLSLNLAGARDALAESPGPSEGLLLYREAVGNLIAAILREIKVWLYREGMLETGLPVPSGAHGIELTRIETLQRSTLHVSSVSDSDDGAKDDTVAISCATGVKMPEHQLSLIESALKAEGTERLLRSTELGRGNKFSFSGGTVMGDWLRVPHSPLAGDSLSFHLPLHRALAKAVKSCCAVVVTEEDRAQNPSWWKIPVLDEDRDPNSTDPVALATHPLLPLLWPTLRSSNCRVVWSAGPDCSPQEAHRRRSRSRNVSANIAIAKVVHSLADHPIRCIAAAQQIERHLWARNGSSVAGMAINYTSTGLCRSFRDLDLLMVQLSASGMSAGLGPRRVFNLLLSRFSMDGYLCDLERRNLTAGGTVSPFASSTMTWVNPPRMQDPDHAVVLAESFFSTLCVVVTELPPPPPCSNSDNTPLHQTIRRELLHALASEPRSRSEAMNAAAIAASRRDDGAAGLGDNGGGGSHFRDVFSVVLNEIAKQKTAGSSRAASGPPAFELKPEFCDEYDPTFYHLRRQDHQHAMDVVARLRKQKWGSDKEAADNRCLPVVCAPPKAHPRFMPCRLLLHLPALDASVRRMLLFALTGGLWLPPSEPRPTTVDVLEGKSSRGSSSNGEDGAQFGDQDVPHVTTFTRRLMHRASSGSSTFKRSNSESDGPTPFSREVVAASAVSFLEVLQLLTLQVHTLEACAALHRSLPDLDEESRQMSASLSINSYLSRLVTVPESLVDVWALKPYPDGPLESRGSGENRGSILGLLIALYEHRADHGPVEDSDEAKGDNDHGGARSLASSGLKWLLRFVSALVDGAPSVATAVKCATCGVPLQQRTPKSPVMSDTSTAAWTINDEVRTTAKRMLKDLQDLWPVKRAKTPTTVESAANKSKEAGKAAQKKMLEKMKMMQNKFATSIAPSDDPSEKAVEEECIICRCDDADGENNGPLGYLGHVQRSRVLQMRCVQEQAREPGTKSLIDSYRVVGHKGCQLRETEAMDSRPLDCLPRGSIVTVLERKFSPEYDILSRRVKVRHETQQGDEVKVTEGWASVQSSQGYIILKPLAVLCYSNTRWGMTRPIIKQCGHAAHLKCVETHTLSLHQRAAGDQPYDGRFAANINDGEFLCPLCKQLSNILIPRDTFASRDKGAAPAVQRDPHAENPENLRKMLCSPRLLTRKNVTNDMCWLALENFGSNMYQAMCITWDRNSRKKQQQQWHPSIRKWDFDEDTATSDSKLKGILRAMREQLIAWSAIGHSAAAAEAGSRGIEEVLPFGTMSQTSDPWSSFNQKSQFDHPMLLELKRTLMGSSGLLEVLCSKFANQLAGLDGSIFQEPVVGACLADAMLGKSWALGLAHPDGQADELLLWSELTSVTASTPCHVARDGVITQKCEARGAASAMWAAMGLGASSSKAGEPPAPFALKRLLQRAGINESTFQEGWGSLEPFVSTNGDAGKLSTPFRPAIASAYLYTPLMAWDLLTFSAAVFSAALTNKSDTLPTGADLMYTSKILMTARVIQCIITPHGVALPDEMELDDDDDCWSPDERISQAKALTRLYTHCRTMVKERRLDADSGLVGSIEGLSPNAVLSGVSAALLPFARALMLLLRATRACIRDRSQSTGNLDEAMNSFAALDKLLCDSELMEVEDGFAFVKALGGPYPSALIDGSGDWLRWINRWLVSVIAFDVHNGPDGPSVASTLLPHLVEKSLTIEASSTASSKRAADQEPSGFDHGAQGAVADASMGSGESGEPAAFDDRPTVIELLNNAAAVAAGELADAEMDEAEEMIDFGEQLMGAPLPLYDVGDEQVESSDDSVYDDSLESDREFAHVSRSPILVYQPSLLGMQSIGPGRQGTTLEYSAASSVMADLSHFGIIHQKQVPTFSLIRLPNSFVELYNIVNKVKGREDALGEDGEESSGSETAICLLTGTVLRSGSARRSSYNRALRPPGACTLHARKNGSGIGIFFLVQKCTVLLMHNNKSAYSPSLYVDEHGEEDPGLRRGRPLFLNAARYRALELLWRQQRVPWEVAQIRSTSDRVIRDHWY